VYLTTKLFYLNPCFQFGKIFADITNIVCFHFDPENLNWVQSDTAFEYNDIFKNVEGKFFSKDRYKVESMYETTLTLFFLIAMFMTLAWYFDNIIPTNRGVPKPYYFFLMPSFWFPSLKSKEEKV